MPKILGLLLGLPLILQISGCTHQHIAFGHCPTRFRTAECYGQNTKDTNLITSSYIAADRLLQGITFFEPFKTRRFFVATIVDLDDLDDSNALGRLVGEHLSIRFSQRGYTVLEPKLRHNLNLVTHTGELVLSRSARRFLLNQHVDAVVAGSYSVGRDTIYVTLKMLDCKDSQIISSYAYTLPIGPNTYALLREFWWQRWWW